MACKGLSGYTAAPMSYRSIRKLIRGVPIIGEVKYYMYEAVGKPIVRSASEGQGALAWSQ